MKTLIDIIRSNIIYRKQILELAIVNQKKTYKGSDLGMLWAFVKPLMYIGVFYVAISVGFKSSKGISGLIDGCPYFAWLTIGMIAWFYMSALIVGGATVFRKNKAYVTRLAYPVEIIPTILSLSNLIVHLGLLAFGLALVMVMGVRPSIYWLEIPFYTILMFLMATIWSMLAGLIGALSKDFINLLMSVSQAFFWLSAILFDVNNIDDPAIQKVFLFNPITYICEGYRNAVVKHIWFFDEPKKLGCYLIVMGIMLILALLCYKRLRRGLPDYL